MERVVAVRVGGELKQLPFHLRGISGLCLLGVKGRGKHGKGLGPTSNVPRGSPQLSLGAGACLGDACVALVLLRRHFCPS